MILQLPRGANPYHCYLINSADASVYGVADGARTHDNRNHNLSSASSIHAGCSPVSW